MNSYVKGATEPPLIGHSIVDAFPATVTGKILKYLIREAMIAEFGKEGRE